MYLNFNKLSAFVFVSEAHGYFICSYLLFFSCHMLYAMYLYFDKRNAFVFVSEAHGYFIQSFYKSIKEL